MTEMAYVKRSARPFEETVDALQTAATDAGWSVLAVHDLKQRFVTKGIEWSPGLRILEMCSAKYAAKMVAASPRMALHLPCRVIVREDADGVELSVLSPEYVAGLFSTDAAEEPEGLTEMIAEVEGVVRGILDAAVG